MKRIWMILPLLVCMLLSAVCAGAEGNAPEMLSFGGGDAYLFDLGGVTCLAGYAGEDVLAQLPEGGVDYVVLCCNHEAHRASATALAEAAGAQLLTREDGSDALTWTDNAVIIGELAFSAEGKVDGVRTLDCQGRYLQFAASTSQSSVNVRQTPTTKGKRVAKLKKGDAVTVVEQVQNDQGETWFRVLLPGGQEGYIRKDLLAVTGDVEVAITPETTESAGDVEVVQPAETIVISDEKSGSSASVGGGSGGGSSGGAGRSSHILVPEGINGYPAFFARTNDGSINVRAKPSTKAERIEQLNEGIAVTVLDEVKSENGQLWYYVQLQDGRKGYIRSDLLVQADSLTDIEQPKKSSSRRYIGNKRTLVFHRTSCHTLPKAKNQVYFSSRDYAIAKGYRPCDNCDP